MREILNTMDLICNVFVHVPMFCFFTFKIVYIFSRLNFLDTHNFLRLCILNFLNDVIFMHSYQNFYITSIFFNFRQFLPLRI